MRKKWLTGRKVSIYIWVLKIVNDSNTDVTYNYLGTFADVGGRFRAGVQKSQEHSSEELLHHPTAIGEVLLLKAVCIFLSGCYQHSVLIV